MIAARRQARIAAGPMPAVWRARRACNVLRAPSPAGAAGQLNGFAVGPRRPARPRAAGRTAESETKALGQMSPNGSGPELA